MMYSLSIYNAYSNFCRCAVEIHRVPYSGVISRGQNIRILVNSVFVVAVKVVKVARLLLNSSFVGKIFVLRDSTTKTNFAPRKLSAILQGFI